MCTHIILWLGLTSLPQEIFVVVFGAPSLQEGHAGVQRTLPENPRLSEDTGKGSGSVQVCGYNQQ